MMKSVFYFMIAIIIIGLAVSTVSFISGDVFAKGLKVYLSVDSNQRAQDGYVTTYQYNNVVANGPNMWVNQGRSDITLQYSDDQVSTGEFKICVRLQDGIESCGNGYNSPESKPEYVNVNINRGQVLLSEPSASGPSQSQSQSSNNENNNENTNALSQSQETKIYICNADGCKVQQ